MRLTAQEEYGLRCLVQLAKAAPESLTIGEVAGHEGLSEAYTAKLMRVLRQSELVESIRGKKGGYTLSRPADEISVGEVLKVLGGNLFSREFCERYPGDEASCVHMSDCSVRVLWGGLELLVQTLLRDCTIADLLKGEGAMRGWVEKRLIEASREVSSMSGRRLPSSVHRG